MTCGLAYARRQYLWRAVNEDGDVIELRPAFVKSTESAMPSPPILAAVGVSQVATLRAASCKYGVGANAPPVPRRGFKIVRGLQDRPDRR